LYVHDAMERIPTLKSQYAHRAGWIRWWPERGALSLTTRACDRDCLRGHDGAENLGHESELNKNPWELEQRSPA
jgi:hypothetical protein